MTFAEPCAAVSLRNLGMISVRAAKARISPTRRSPAPVRCRRFERCLWGTDWTRAFAVVNCEQGVEPFLKTDRLSDTEQAMLMGGAYADREPCPP
jgi:hypothetical protein